MMLTGLEILLARMKTNPEEFLKDNSVPYDGERFGGKWGDLLDYAWRVATEEERKALDIARDEFYRDDFNERVMKRLAGEEQEQEEHPMQKFRIKTPAQNAAQALTHQQKMQNSVLISNQGAIQGGQYDPNLHGVLTTTGGFQAAETKQEGMPISNGGTGFLGLGKLFWGQR
jgi:hypothetical protein